MSHSRRSSTPFDRARIGTHTRHGIMPGPRGFSAAKINQDRGVVCWPFNGSYNQVRLQPSRCCPSILRALVHADNWDGVCAAQWVWNPT